MKNIIIALSLFTCLVCITSNSLASSEFFNIRLHMPPDTTLFAANEREDWRTIDSYVTVADSTVSLELLLTRKVDGRTDWDKLTVIGRIDKEYAPRVRTDFLIKQPARVWKIVISEKGRCFIKLVKGREPRRRATTYISFKLIYKK